MPFLPSLPDDAGPANVFTARKPRQGITPETTAGVRAQIGLTPSEMNPADADAVFEAGWNEQALHDAIAVTARAAFMQRLVEGHGFTPMSRETAAKHAKRRVERGYVNLYPVFRSET